MEEYLKYDRNNDLKGYWIHVRKMAAEQNKDVEVYLAEQSNIIKRMLIGNHEEKIEELKKIISKDAERFQGDSKPASA
jgi:hypothetical protein